MADKEPANTGTAGYYREKAQELIEKAKDASTEQARAEFLLLADHWHRLAQTLERPNW